YRAARGTEDLFPDRIPLLEHVFGSCREVFLRHGYGEIRTPMLEETQLFERSLGVVTDVVQKEMFTVTRGDTSVTFRPEGTAPVVRAYLEHNLDKVRPFQKLYYIGPMFRFERPQAGRARQFDQVGIEVLGSRSPLVDAEVVLLAHRCFEAIGLQNYKIHINTIGDNQDRDRFRAVLKDHFEPLLGERCDDCKQRFQRNVFRMLDCKVKGCQPSNQQAPKFRDHVSHQSRVRFEESLELLEPLDVPLTVDDNIVRGFDYYTHTVFEVRCPDLGARDAICGGGRYDHLIADMGGPDLGAMGFAIGVTPTLLALAKQGHESVKPQGRGTDVFIVPVTGSERQPAFLLAEQLRGQGLQVDTDYEERSVRALFKAADKRGVKLLVVLGPDELAAGEVKVKDLRHSEELTLKNDSGLAAALAGRLSS
ncbi:MAG: histidine--tRNA ligase, partial [Planctomycetota bacterium]